MSSRCSLAGRVLLQDHLASVTVQLGWSRLRARSSVPLRCSSRLTGQCSLAGETSARRTITRRPEKGKATTPSSSGRGTAPVINLLSGGGLRPSDKALTSPSGYQEVDVAALVADYMRRVLFMVRLRPLYKLVFRKTSISHFSIN